MSVRASDERAPVWSLPEALLVAIVGFALLIGVQAIFGEASRQPVSAGLTLLGYDIALGVPLFFLARRHGVGVLEAFRLDRLPELRTVLLAAVLLVVTIVFSPTYRIVLTLAGVRAPASDGPALPQLFGDGPLAVAMAVLVVVIVGPLVEEVALRGVLLGALDSRIGGWPATLVSALVFSLLHASVYSFLPLLVLGIALGRVAVGRRSLWPAIVFHMAYNAWFVVAALYMAGR